MTITGKTENQKNYIRAIYSDDIILCNAPAGCGKSYIAVGIALDLLRRNKGFDKIIVSRPMVPCSGYSDLGSLPGDLSEKCAPMFAPILDILEKILGRKEAAKLIESKILQFIPPEFIRGHTFENTIVILDEWQNAGLVETVCAITRMGINSKYIIIGDVGQKDIRSYSGLELMIDQLKYTNLATYVKMTEVDNQRHPKIQAIIKALDYHSGDY